MKKFNLLSILMGLTFFVGSVFSSDFTKWCDEELNKIRNFIGISYFNAISKSYPDVKKCLMDLELSKQSYDMMVTNKYAGLVNAKKGLNEIFVTLKAILESAKTNYYKEELKTKKSVNTKLTFLKQVFKRPDYSPVSLVGERMSNLIKKGTYCEFNGKSVCYGVTAGNTKCFFLAGPEQKGAQCGLYAFTNATSVIDACVSDSFPTTMGELLAEKMYNNKYYDDKIEKLGKFVNHLRLIQFENIKINKDLDKATRDDFSKDYGSANNLSFQEMVDLNNGKTHNIYNGFGISIIAFVKTNEKGLNRIFSDEDFFKSKELDTVRKSLYKTGLELICTNICGHWLTVVLYLMPDKNKVKVGPPILINSGSFFEGSEVYYKWFLEPLYLKMS